MPMFGRMDFAWLPGNRWMRRSLLAAIVLYGWTIFGILSSAHFFLGEEARTGGASLADIAGHVLVFYWAWAAVTPLVWLAMRRAADERASSRQRWSVILLATPVIVLAHGAIYLVGVRLAGVEAMTPFSGAELREYAMRHVGGDVATVAVLVAVYLLFDARRRAHAREVAQAALEARVAAADLEVLRWQLQPHFLFNALNTVSTLVLKSENAGADEAIGRISRYLRSALAQRADAMVTVSEELASVQEYFAIERMRFGDALCLDAQIDAEACVVRIPSLIVQPLVENAIRHGSSPAAGRARVGIRASVSDGRVRLEVSDPAAGDIRANGNGDRAEGFGLRYVRERLAHFYGADASVTLEKSSAGTVVTLDMPLALRSPVARA
ncbi:MAG TPA: histidine kinase [Gemmatimonadaceae bacterium]|nr:histidine kinase [Gemmatimonadaceae bacterium]